MVDVPPPSNGAPGVYVHLPFCSVKCTYCDFPVAAGQDHRIERYLAALEREIAQFGPRLEGTVDTIYFGGGTPSRLPPEAIAGIVRSVRARYGVADDVEISLEANPEDLVGPVLEGLRGAGVDRVTIGIQSLDDAVLRRTGRLHDVRAALDAIGAARRAGFRSVGADLIAGLPGERRSTWSDGLGRVLDRSPDHVSLYLLETDQPSALAKAIAAGRERAMSDDDQAWAYETAVVRLEASGLEAYEISNFAAVGHRSRHNLKYWTDAWYAGFGLGAHAYAHGARRGNVRGLSAYLRRVESGTDPVDEVDPWDPVRRVEEALFLGLRRVEGVDLAALGTRYDVDLVGGYREVWARHARAGRVEVDGCRVRLTPAGRLGSDAVFRDVLGELAAPEGPGRDRA